MKIQKGEKLFPYLYGKTKYAIQIRNLEQSLNNGLFLIKIHREVKFNQKAWLNPNINMNTDLIKAAKKLFKKIHFQANE